MATAAKKRPGENEDGEDGPAKKRKPKAKAKGKSKSKAKRVEDAKESKPESEKGEKVEDNLEVPIPSSSAPVLPPPCDAAGRYEDLWKEKEWVGVQIVIQVRKLI